jgi:hypothetical protein
MVVKCVDAEVPEIARPLGYDLVLSDWVHPYGRGEISDFVFEAERWSISPNAVNGCLRLGFSNPGDGLFPVSLHWRNSYGLKLAALAPNEGYKQNWIWAVGEGCTNVTQTWTAAKNCDEDANYYLRVRTKVDTKGNVTGGLYGKIYGGIGLAVWDYRTNTKVSFSYYLNPDGTRNTEWDTRSNLCSNPGDISGRP